MKKRKFISQLKFINKRIINLMNIILSIDKGDKIIIIQGDHGTRMLKPNGKFDISQDWVKEEFGNLNCIFYEKNQKIRKDIPNLSTVNTFRFILNEQFGYNLKYLDDNKYHTNLVLPLNFNKIIK